MDVLSGESCFVVGCGRIVDIGAPDDASCESMMYSMQRSVSTRPFSDRILTPRQAARSLTLHARDIVIHQNASERYRLGEREPREYQGKPLHADNAFRKYCFLVETDFCLPQRPSLPRLRSPEVLGPSK